MKVFFKVKKNLLGRLGRNRLRLAAYDQMYVLFCLDAGNTLHAIKRLHYNIKQLRSFKHHFS